jgi:hypothetical protein
MIGWFVTGSAVVLVGLAAGCEWARRRHDRVLCRQRFEDWLREEQQRRALVRDRG